LTPIFTKIGDIKLVGSKSKRKHTQNLYDKPKIEINISKNEVNKKVKFNLISKYIGLSKI